MCCALCRETIFRVSVSELKNVSIKANTDEPSLDFSAGVRLFKA